jgi:putative ABC transport system permease protein
MLLDGEKFAVVGIMPPYFQFLGKDLWVPLAFSPSDLAERDSHYLSIVARLKQGVKLKQAQADLETITRRIVQDHPIDAYKLRAYLLPLREQLAGEVRPALIVLLLAVGCVLLIACANIANLQLSRATARNREIAVRTALGASRGRIVRQLLTESVLLAGLGGLAGLLVAEWSFTFLKQLIPESMALSTQVRIDAQVLGYASLISLVTGVIFGMAPAAQAAKVDLNQSLKQSAGRTTLVGGGKKLRGSLVVAEVALSFTLLVGAGLLIQTFVHLRHLDPGFRPENLLIVNTTLPQRKYAELPKRAAFYQQVLERVKTLPGVISAAYTTAVPLTWKGGTNGFGIQGRRTQMYGQDANHRQISPNYFQTLGIPLRRGRFFDEHDGPQSMPVAIINETMARQFWPDEDALGKRFKLGPPDSSDPWWTIVGVVGDVKQMGLEVPTKAEMYFPYQQMPGFFFFAPQTLVIRTAADPMSLATAVQREIWTVDPTQPVSDITTMERILESEVAQRRSGMTLLAAFATLALLLASLGIYGVLSYGLTLRTQEIGVRLALGAQPGDVWRMVVSEGLGLAFLGVGLGLAASLALTRFLASLLFNVSATDMRTFALVSLLLISVAFVASYLPARRATKVDPMVALRNE